MPLGPVGPLGLSSPLPSAAPRAPEQASRTVAAHDRAASGHKKHARHRGDDGDALSVAPRNPRLHGVLLGLHHTAASAERGSNELVGVRGLEPPTSASRTLRASQLRYTPMD
jgi:hypothetical protein